MPQECGRVQAIREKSDLGQSNGAGAVIGGVGGFLLGKALTDSTLGQLTAAGAGAAVGNYAQRQMSSTKSWVIDLRFNDGRTMEISHSSSLATSCVCKTAALSGRAHRKDVDRHGHGFCLVAARMVASSTLLAMKE